MGSKKYRNKILIELCYNGPAFDGETGSEKDLLCKNCSFVLAIDILPPSLFGVYIKCPKCGVVTLAAKRSLGYSMPLSSKNVLLKPNNNSFKSYKFSGVVKLRNLPLIASAELDKYRIEVGYKQNLPISVDQATIQKIIRKCEEVIGKERYKAISKSNLRQTDRSKVHSLVAANEKLKECLHLNNAYFYKFLAVNLVSAKTVLQHHQLTSRWSQSASAREIIYKKMSDPQEFLHDTALLSIARWFVDSLELGPNFLNKSEISDPDLMLQVTASQQLFVEVKTPDISTITNKIREIIRKAAKQHIDSRTPTLVVISVNEIDKDEFEILNKEFESIMADQNNFKSKKLLCGVILINHRTTLDLGDKIFSTSMDVRTKRNINYTGTLEIKF